MPLQDGETMTEYTIRRMKDEILSEAITAAEGGMPSNEPGNYAKGRFAAADAIRALLSERIPE